MTRSLSIFLVGCALGIVVNGFFGARGVVTLCFVFLTLALLDAPFP